MAIYSIHVHVDFPYICAPAGETSDVQINKIEVNACITALQLLMFPFNSIVTKLVASKTQTV